ncbi:MAG: polysaccharide biosynthesis protein [Actinophytocola sp.]|nr:polysaccharide biosynthesis protein [Actinophytocola sp.]
MTTPTDTTKPAPLVNLPQLVAAIRWRRRMWVSFALVGLLLGLAFALLMPPQPTAVTRLQIVHENDHPSDGGSLMATDLALLRTARIAEATLRQVGVNESPERFAKTYEAEGLTSNVLELTVRASSPTDAIARARALADTFIADHLARTKNATEAEAEALRDRHAKLRSELGKIDDEISEATSSTQNRNVAGLDSLYVRRADLIAQSHDLGRRVTEAEIGAPRVQEGSRVVDPPRLLPRSIVMTAATYALTGLVLGLGGGLGLAAVAGVVRDRPVLRRDIAAHLGASVIAQLPATPRGPKRLWRRSRAVRERTHVAATLARAVRVEPGAFSLLELGCADTAAVLALGVATALDGPVMVIDDLPKRTLARRAGQVGDRIRVVESDQQSGGPQEIVPDVQYIGVGSVEPGTTWTGLRALGTETVLVVRTGYADTTWLHTVARQLADARIPVIGIVLVHPDPRDRTDGTLWDGLHTALRGRSMPTDEDATRPRRQGPGTQLRNGQTTIAPVRPNEQPLNERIGRSSDSQDVEV